MVVYSHSRLSTFEQCSLKFKFAYIDKLETEIESTIEAFLGSRVHEVLEKIYKDLKFAKENSLQDLLKFYNEEWKKNFNSAIVIVRKEYDENNYRLMGERFITDYYNRYHPFNQAKTIGLETEETAALDPEGKYQIHIRIDRLAVTKDNVYEIHDYKTANSLPTQEDLDNDRQLAIYAYGIKKMYPDAKKIRLIWHYLAFDKEMSSQRTDEQLENLRAEVLALVKKVEAEIKFVPKESALCKWCQYQAHCPNFKHMFALEKKETNEYLNDDGVKIVNKYAQVSEEIKKNEAELEKLKEALLAYAKKEDVKVVFGSDIRATIGTYPQLSFPKKEDLSRDAFIETIKKIGLWDKLASVDTYELAKMLNNGDIHPELAKLLHRFIKTGEVTKIYLRKK